ncbi:hypothetical protein [Rhodococcus sp. MEB041]|uniref:hypothetical protein n=1 Tax=Rhodococcus sp. MEB041 TaxID=3040323 RepID=UPI0025508465|nr:hypothetical protein [Rhodococcus sp. MEB041]
MTGIDLSRIEQRARNVAEWFREKDEMDRIRGMSNLLDTDVPALVERVRELEATVFRLRRYVAREAFTQGGLPAAVVDAHSVVEILDAGEPT